MYDPLSASSADVPVKAAAAGSSAANGVTSPPATPSKSRILSGRPPPYRPVVSTNSANNAASAATPSRQHQGYQAGPSGLMPSNHAGSMHAGPSHSNASFTTTYQSQSSMAPRPPLPGQIQRPVSPIRWDSTSSNPGSAAAATQQSSAASTSQVYSPDTPNAWASTSPQRSMSATQPPPGPVGLPSPVATPSWNGQQQQQQQGYSQPRANGMTSPGIARSPVAERNERSILAQTQPEGQSPRSQQPSTPRAPPYVRIRVHGIDRAKKELGIKMDAQTNIPTYHRQHSNGFSRTYAEFAALHGALSANHPETILPALPLPQTSATSEDEEDRFLKGIFQRFIDRITRDRPLILDDELRSFVEADFGVGHPC